MTPGYTEVATRIREQLTQNNVPLDDAVVALSIVLSDAAAQITNLRFDEAFINRLCTSLHGAYVIHCLVAGDTVGSDDPPVVH